MANYRSEDFIIGSKESPIRASFTQTLFKARAIQPGAPERYGCTLIIPKASEWLPLLRDKVTEALKQAFGPGAVEKAQQGILKIPVLDGAGKSARNKSTGELHPGYGPDVVFIRTVSGFKPGVFTMEGRPAESDAEVYSGCYGKASIHIFTWTNSQQGQGASVGINLFQMLKHGDKLGGGAPDPAAFVEKVADAGPAPASMQGGAGAAGVFASAPKAAADESGLWG